MSLTPSSTEKVTDVGAMEIVTSAHHHLIVIVTSAHHHLIEIVTSAQLHLIGIVTPACLHIMLLNMPALLLFVVTNVSARPHLTVIVMTVQPLINEIIAYIRLLIIRIVIRQNGPPAGSLARDTAYDLLLTIYPHLVIIMSVLLMRMLLIRETAGSRYYGPGIC